MKEEKEMNCNNCKEFSIGKLRVMAKSSNKKAFYFVHLLKCGEMNITLRAIRESQGLEDIKIPNVSPVWNCPELQRLRKENRIPKVELSVLNGYTNNEFGQWIKIN